jgi:ubiquinone/menaquinone biosynthesis C-methylase UbiE
MATDTLDVRDLSNIKTHSHVFTNVGLPVPGDPNSSSKVTKEIYRVLKRNGVAMVSTWAGMEYSWDFHLSKFTLLSRSRLVNRVLQRGTLNLTQ